ncbi:MAG: hypothetical protein RLZZ535_107 [Cyanobacteriota bacterium]|jgi:hypothetical protein
MSEKLRLRVVILASLFLLSTTLVTCAFANSKNPIDEQVVRLGNPLAADGQTERALNVWDLQVFNHKVYIAGGSTVTNSGPINVWAYNPAINSFAKEYTIQEEAIEHYKVFGNQLYIPAADPRNADHNKYYRQNDDNTWRKYTSDRVKLAHVRDLIQTNENHILLVGNNRYLNQDAAAPGIAITTNQGRSFQAAGVDNIPNQYLVDYNWFFTVFSYQNQIYAPSALLRDIDNYPNTIAVYNPETQKFFLDKKLKNDEFIPKQQLGKNNNENNLYTIYRIWNPVEYGQYLIYPVRSYCNTAQYYEQFYMNSLGMYLKEDIGKSPEVIKLPYKAIGEDILVINNELYVLANRKGFRDRFTIYVFKTNDPTNQNSWQKVVNFKNSNKARSFEYLDGKFYFGLGQDYGEAIANSGDILSYTP